MFGDADGMEVPPEPIAASGGGLDAAGNYSYDEIDRHALAAPKSAEQSVQSLAAYLIEPAKNDREKARAIFRWICENIDYDLESYFTGRIGSTNSTDVLRSRSSVCSGYSDLFSSLAGEAGLEAVKIVGYGKGYSYSPGENFTGPYNHAWNAVKINGSWYLVDATWGAGYLGSGGYVRWFDDHYFLTPPSQFIFDHLPDDERWQILDRPVSKEEYERRVYVESDFFNLGLELGQRNGSIDAGGEVNVSVYAPEDVVMMASLESKSGSLEGMTFCQRDGERYDIWARFPEAGRYILKAFAKRKDDPGNYNSVLQYVINASSGDDRGFPATFGRFGEVGAYLFSPMNGSLTAGESYHFKIRVPGASEVAVVCGNEWSRLEAEGELFEGNVTVTEGDAGIFANFGGGKWEGMVKYGER
ncbi:MAG: transglutaminase domain-containing protein [Methanothrix sp.]